MVFWNYSGIVGNNLRIIKNNENILQLNIHYEEKYNKIRIYTLLVLFVHNCMSRYVRLDT